MTGEDHAREPPVALSAMIVGDDGDRRRASPAGYAGIVTRGVALVIDAVILDLIAIVVAAAVQLLISLFTGHKQVGTVGLVVTGILWFMWAGLYFSTFWNLTGQTLGNRLLGIRVTTVDGGDLGAWQAIRRYFGLVLAALPLGLGFVPVLFNDRRRGLQDWIGGTVVRWVEHPGDLPAGGLPGIEPPVEPTLAPSAPTTPAALRPSDS